MTVVPETITKPLSSLRFAPDVLPPVSDTVSKTTLSVESAVDSKTIALPAPKTKETKEIVAKPVAEIKKTEKSKENGLVMIPHPASDSTPPKISDAEMDAWKSALANSVENTAGKTVDVKSIPPKALKPAKTIADLVASEKIDLKSINERVSPTTTVMKPGIPTAAPQPEPESNEPIPPLSKDPIPPPPMDPRFLATPSETSDKSVENEKQRHDWANTAAPVPDSISKPESSSSSEKSETAATSVPATVAKADDVSESKEILRGQSPAFNLHDDSLGSRPPNPQGVIADPSAIQEKLVETPKSADPTTDPAFDITAALTPGTTVKPVPVLNKSQQWTNSLLLISTLGSLGALIYVLTTALDYRNRWMQSLTSQNNRLSFAFDGAAEGLAPTEDTDLYVDPYTNPYSGFPKFAD